VYRSRLTLAKALAFPFLIYLLIAYFDGQVSNSVEAMFVALLEILVHTVFAVTTHRVLLLGSSSVTEWGFIAWSKRETYYVLCIVGMVVMMLPFALVSVIPVIGPFLAMVLILWLLGRFSLVFPGTALDKDLSFQKSWAMTENYQLLMFLVVGIFPFLAAVPAVLLMELPYASLLAPVFSALAVVFQVAGLSMAYQLIVQEQSDSS
jgi:hypothetical protein